MAKVFIILLLLLYYSVKAKTENEYEVIDEFIPKLIFSNMPDKIFKYSALCGDKRNETNIFFQGLTYDKYIFYIYFYDDFTKIKKDNGYYVNYISVTTIPYKKPVITFNNTMCNKDYYFVIPKPNGNDIFGESFIQITIFNDETNIFKLSPLLSMDYTLFPRKSTKEECFSYSFNESKYVVIDYNGILRIEENGQIISDFYKTNKTQFKKDLEYKIYYKANTIERPIDPPQPHRSPAIHFHFYNEESFFKYNKEDFPIMLYGIQIESYFEINISDYNVGDYVLFYAFGGNDWKIKYQYKNDFKNNNFINLGYFWDFNYIPIQKTKNDSSLLLYIKYTRYYDILTMINIVKEKVMEIAPDFNSELNGPKFLFLDYYNKFNNLESLAIESNKKLYFFIQEIGYIIEMEKEYNYIYISKQNEDKPLINKRIFIYLNSKDNWHLVIKKLNFLIKENDNRLNGHEYLDLCQGEEPKKELYLYKSYYLTELFIPVFGNFDLFFINNNEINTLSNFDFSKINETMEFIPRFQEGYLKIVCKEPTLIKRYYIYELNEESILIPGKRYIFSTKNFPKKIELSDTLIGKNISLKFSIFGAKNNNQVKLNLNESEYILSNDNKSLEFELKSYQENNPYLINFDIEKDIKEEMLIETIVVTKEDLSEFQIKNLNESFGNLNADEKKGIIIKVPKEYDESYYNYSIIQNKLNHYYRYYIDISYDKIEFMTLKIKYKSYQDENYEYTHFMPLFKVNPYSYIPNNSIKSDDKFFYILLFNYGISKEHILIKKPKLFTDININKVNTFPQLKGEDKKYYYKILIPCEGYDSLLIQTDKNINTTFSFEKDNKIYPLDQSFYHHFRFTVDAKYSLHYIPIHKNKNIYLNYYGNSFSDGFVRFMSGNEVTLDVIDGLHIFSLNFEAMKKEQENKLILKLNSYSYFAKRPIIYYLIINEQYIYDNEKIIFSALTKERNFDKNKMMLKVEDNGENESFITEVEINKKLFVCEPGETDNSILIVPVDKETNLTYIHLKQYAGYECEIVKKSKYIYIIIIIIAILFLIIIIGILLYKKNRKEKGNNIEDEMGNNERILADD